MLFSSYIRDNTEHKSRKETAFEFLDRSAWKISEIVREKVNELCVAYKPDSEFVKMFKSKSDKQHYSSVFELLIYSIFSRSNFSLTRHPETSTGKKPDFKATAKEFETFIECTLAGHSFDSLTDKNRKDAIEEIVDDIGYYPYWINLDFQTVSDQSVSKKKLLSFLSRVKEMSEGIPNEQLFEKRHLFEDNGWEIEISMLRKTSPGIKRSLGFVSGGAKTINTSKPILTALNDKKATRYGIDTEPYLICLNTNDLFTGENCFTEALWGQYSDTEIDINYITQSGFFLSGGKPINTSVSAVVIFRNLDLYTLDNSSMAVWHNPYAKNKIPLNILPFDEYIYEIDGTVLKVQNIKKNKCIFDMLGIDRDKYIASKALK